MKYARKIFVPIKNVDSTKKWGIVPHFVVPI